VYTYKYDEFASLHVAVRSSGAGGGAGVPEPPGFHSHAIINQNI